MVIQDRLLKELKELVIDLKLQPGQRLPSERSLSTRLGVSRNSLRRLIHVLEERGLVEIRQGSGSYLKANAIDLYENTIEKHSDTPLKPLKDQLYACNVFLPSIVEKAAGSISEDQLALLTDCIISINEIHHEYDIKSLLNESISFFKIVALSTENYFIIKILEQICFTELILVELGEIGRHLYDKIFKDHVNLLKALKNKNRSKARKITGEYITTLIEMVEKTKFP